MRTVVPPNRAPSAIPGLILLFPALLFVAANLLKFELGLPFLYDLVEPVVNPRAPAFHAVLAVVVIGGPVAALAISLLSIARLGFRREDGVVFGTVAARLRGPHLAVIVISLAILATIAGYLVAENLPCITGARLDC
ncbi:MAG: hypothetical protein ACT4PO_03615 [Actinomycetota bacterium]